MAIVRMLPDMDPAEVAEGQMVLVDSDAPDNAKAILEVEQWCREAGLVRAQERWLQTLRVSADRVLRRARCYRPYSEEAQEITQEAPPLRGLPPGADGSPRHPARISRAKPQASPEIRAKAGGSGGPRPPDGVQGQRPCDVDLPCIP